jgi:hypothetical protein
MTPTQQPVRVTGKPRFSGRGANRVQVVYLPLGQYPVAKGWAMHSGGMVGNTWHKPAPIKKPRT